jgi:predicted nucleic acid-binding protein
MADAIVYATALVYKATLITSDADFKRLPGVVYLPKK